MRWERKNLGITTASSMYNRDRLTELQLRTQERRLVMVKEIEEKAGSMASGDLAEERLEGIRRRAHELYEARGREEGHDLEDWMQAEAESKNPK